MRRSWAFCPSTTTPLTDADGPWDETAPAWSPDGLRVAFLSNRRRLAPGGSPETVVDSAGSDGDFTSATDTIRGDEPAQAPCPQGLAVGPDGTVYVADGPVRRLRPGGVWEDATDSAGSDGGFTQAWSVAAAPDGTLYAWGDDITTLRRLAPGGVWQDVTDAAGSTGALSGVYGLAVDGAGVLYAIDWYDTIEVKRLAPAGQWEWCARARQQRPGPTSSRAGRARGATRTTWSG